MLLQVLLDLKCVSADPSSCLFVCLLVCLLVRLFDGGMFCCFLFVCSSLYLLVGFVCSVFVVCVFVGSFLGWVMLSVVLFVCFWLCFFFGQVLFVFTFCFAVCVFMFVLFL